MTARSMPVQDSSRQYLPLMLLLFVGSGCAALIYEIVWFQLLQLVDRLVGGLARRPARDVHGRDVPGQLPAAALHRREQHPLRVYAILELGIGVIGSAAAVRDAAREHASTRPSAARASWLVLRAMVAGICLLPPTLLMGATLPAVARWVETTPTGVSWLGFFYGGNIGGAVIGSLLAGFYLLRVYDMAVATYVAVALNVTVAVLGAGCSRSHAARSRRPTADGGRRAGARRARRSTSPSRSRA